MNHAILIVKANCITTVKRPLVDSVDGLVALYRQCKAIYPDCILVAVDTDGDGRIQVEDVAGWLGDEAVATPVAGWVAAAGDFVEYDPQSLMTDAEIHEFYSGSGDD